MDFPLLLLRGIDFAAKKHSRQRRKNPEKSPYIEHPIRVAYYLMEAGGIEDLDVILAAILHDTLEDTKTTPEEIASAFGARVLAIVREVTDDKSLPKDIRKQLQVEHASHLSPEARLVKLSDKICNVRDVINDPPRGWNTRRRREYLQWAKSVVDGLRGANSIMEQDFDELYASGIQKLG